MGPKFKNPRTRYLSAAQAADCENATSPASSCRCRCNGAAHGRNVLRAEQGLGLTPDTWELGKDDPHRSRPPTPMARDVVRKLRADAAAAGSKR